MATGDTPRKPLEGMGGPQRINMNDRVVYGCEGCGGNIHCDPWKPNPRSPYTFHVEMCYRAWKADNYSSNRLGSNRMTRPEFKDLIEFAGGFWRDGELIVSLAEIEAAGWKSFAPS